MRTFSAKIFSYLAKPILLVAVFLPIVLTACGYRGPLYLPDEAPGEQPAEISTPNNTGDLPAEESEDEEDGVSRV